MEPDPVSYRSALKRITDPRRPWLWLAYLALYFVTWIGNPPDTSDLIWSAIGLSAFLVLYIWASRLRGRILIVPAVAILLIGFALAPTGGNWSVLSIYAVAVAAELRPAREGGALICALLAASIAFAGWLGVPWFFVALLTLFALMVAISKMSGIALGEKQSQLLMAQDEVRRLSRETERERIARDLHDLLGRTLTLVALKADLAARLVVDDAQAARDEMRDVAKAARDSLADVRAAVAGMTTAGLRREVEASRSALETAGIACDIVGDIGDVSAADGAVLAMALRESVTNVIRHAEAQSCIIRLVADTRSVNLTVIDDGRGGHFREGSGIAGMRSRLSAAGGQFEIAATAEGTTVCAAVPVRA